MENTNAKRADLAINKAVCDENFQGAIREYAIVVEEDSGEILFFLPLNSLYRLKRKVRKDFLNAIQREWVASQFEILESREVSMEECCEVGFDSQLFRIKSIA